MSSRRVGWVRRHHRPGTYYSLVDTDNHYDTNSITHCDADTRSGDTGPPR